MKKTPESAPIITPIVMPAVTAHRGASADAPENTLAAIRLAAKQGATWIEIDVGSSRDNIAVLHHDDNVSRCSNGQGLVLELTLDELKALDSGSWFAPEFSSETVATLDECLDLCLALKLSINLEIKPVSGWEVPTSQIIANTLARRESNPAIVISSFSTVALETALATAPELPRALLYVVTPPDWQQQAARLAVCNIHLHANSLLTAEQVEEFHQANLRVYCYTVNTVEQADTLFALGVDGVISNFPARLLAGAK